MVRDTTPPDTRILSTNIQPGSTASSSTVTITLQGLDAVGIRGFMCAFDSPTFNPCSSIVVLSNVRPGAHIFAAYSIYTSGNVDPSPAPEPIILAQPLKK